MSFLLEHGVQFSAALDPHRRAAYQRALESAFKQFAGKPSIALMGWQAATMIDIVAGRASRIVIVEGDDELVEGIRNGLVEQGLGKDVQILHEDPTTVALDERVDIVVCGLSTTWFVQGPAAAVMNNARQNVLKKQGMMIPRRFVHLFELACSPTEINGISMNSARYGRPGEPFPALSESKHFIDTDFTSLNPAKTDIEDTIIVKPLLSGTMTGLRLTSLVELGDNNVHLAGHSGFQSVFVPLREAVEVTAREPVSIFMKFGMGEGWENARFMARSVSQPERSPIPSDILKGFHAKIAEMVDTIDGLGRAQDLDKVVSYTVDPHGDVSRLTALFWTIDEEFKRPIRDLVDGFRQEAMAQGANVTDEDIYDTMLQVYRQKRGQSPS